MAVSFTREEMTAITGGECLKAGQRRTFTGVSIDSRSVHRGGVFIAIRGANLDGHDFISQAMEHGAGCVVIDRKVRAVCTAAGSQVCVIRVADTTQALGAVARAHRLRFDLPVIAVTGSAGKTTTKEMIAGLLSRRYRVLKSRGSFNNHWGVPLTLLQLSSAHDVAVIEAGTNHPGEIPYLAGLISPTIAVLTNVGSSHLEGFQSVENVYREKRTLADALPSDGTVVFNADDPFLRRLSRGVRPRYTFGICRPADITASDIALDEKARLVFKINGRYSVRMQTPVRENVLNVLAAAACARLLKLSFREICAGIDSLRFDGNRQNTRSMGGVFVINDSYNANPVSFTSAVNTLSAFPAAGKKILVCGDMLELGKDTARLHREMGALAARSGINVIAAFGPLMTAHFVTAARAADAGIKVFARQRGREALHRFLAETVVPGDVVLVKGSRGMRMETAVQFLENHLT